MNKTRALKLSMFLINLFLVILVVLAFALPGMITKFVETTRSQKLPSVIMITCYPCVPLVGAMLLYLRKLLKNILKDMLFHVESGKCFTRISQLCIAIACITTVAGKSYTPFFVVGVAFAFFALLVFVFKNCFIYIAEKVDSVADGEKETVAEAPETESVPKENEDA